MIKAAFILVVFLNISFLCNAQQKIIKEQYCKQIDQRGYDGDYIAYVVKLFTDYTIEFQTYYIKGMMFDAPIHRTTYFGTYYQANDTCIITSVSGYAETSYRGRKEISKSIITPKHFFFKLPLQFLISDNAISSLSFLFPVLTKSDYTKINAIEGCFPQWGK